MNFILDWRSRWLEILTVSIVEKRLSEAVLTRFQVANPHESDVALQKAGVAYCAARACFIKGHSAPPATPAGRPPN